MRRQIDIVLDFETDDLKINNGDFGLDESTITHQKQLLQNAKGDFKERPDVCVGIDEFLDDESPADLLREVRVQFAGDGMRVQKLGVKNGTIYTSAEYI